MNELMISFVGGNYLYYKTLWGNAVDAIKDFYSDCNSLSINIDNMRIVGAVLRDEEGNDIDLYVNE